MLGRRSNSLANAVALQDACLTALAVAGAYWIRTSILIHFLGPSILRAKIYTFHQQWPVLVVFLAVSLAGGHLLHIYRDSELRDNRRVIWDIFKLVVLGLFAVNALLYLFRADYVSRAFVLTVGPVDFALLVLGRLILLPGNVWMRTRLHSQDYCLIVGTGPLAQEVGAMVEESKSFGLHLIGFVTLGGPSPLPHADIVARHPVFTMQEASDILQNHVVDDLIITGGKNDLEELGPMIKRCHEEGIRMRLALSFLPHNFQYVQLDSMQDVPLLTLGSTPDNELALFVKRAFDVMVSATALVLLSPLLLLIAVLVRLTSPGPVLYRQRRCGLNGRRFMILKFRSMVANAEALRPHYEPFNEVRGAAFKMANDPRCTKLGRWIRRFGLDELPQLWNVLRGDMSIVGPRPSLEEDVKKYEPWQRRRLRMRPGLTCLYIVENHNRQDFGDLAQFDIAYIDSWSLLLDFKIFVRTIPRVVTGRGAS
jgi:exopolysaccharide biosynthesis polyprenyl glycosylphosphotransferase